MLPDFRWIYPAVILGLISEYFLLFILHDTFNTRSGCIFRNVTVLPCPACGSTRSAYLLLNGNLRGSLMMNHFGLLTTVLIVCSIFCMISDLVQRRDTFLPFLKKDWNRIVKIMMILSVLLNWAWNIKKGI